MVLHTHRLVGRREKRYPLNHIEEVLNRGKHPGHIIRRQMMTKQPTLGNIEFPLLKTQKELSFCGMSPKVKEKVERYKKELTDKDQKEELEEMTFFTKENISNLIYN